MTAPTSLRPLPSLPSAISRPFRSNCAPPLLCRVVLDSPPSPPPEPNTVTTILQCDIEGSTRLAGELGDESWADLLGHYGRLADLAVTAAIVPHRIVGNPHR